MFHGDVCVKTVPVLVCFSTGGAGVLDPLNVRLNVLLHVSSCLSAYNRFSANSTDPRSIRLSARIKIHLVKVEYPEYAKKKKTHKRSMFW